MAGRFARIEAVITAAVALAAMPLASAQPDPTSTEAATCRTEQAVLMQEIDAARARGRMLQRRQLASELEVLQARCDRSPSAQRREAAINRLQTEILELRKKLDLAETELRTLRQGL